ncbi:ATP-binding protein [Thermodesulfobacteriota bacterium]
MTNNNSSFEVGIDFEHVLAAISKQIYETPFAFLRENVQNAIDAIRIQALRDKISTGDESYRIDIDIDERSCTIRDNGIGMTRDDLRKFYWTIGASGKRTQEAKDAGCVGIFGIGGFANLGVCDELKVISQTENSTIGTYTSLSEQDIKNAVGTIPEVKSEESADASPRGTIVIGHLREKADVTKLKQYIHEIVRYTEEAIYFNGELISKEQFISSDRLEDYTAVRKGLEIWENGNIQILGEIFEDRGYTLIVSISGLLVGDTSINLSGLLRFENGAINVFKRGFKLCATKIGTHIGVSGRIDCDSLSPTAGRDSLNAESAGLLGKIIALLERVAVETVLESSDRIAQNTRIFPYILQRGLIDNLDNVVVRLADGDETILGNLRVKSEGKVGVYYGKEQKQALSQIMQARGNIVVLLPSDRHKQNAVKKYLEVKCNAKPFEGIVECTEFYSDLTRFEQVFLSEMETHIIAAYEVSNLSLIPGKLTEDIPVFLSDIDSRDNLEIFLDVRHPEISKLEALGITPLLYSMVAAFCREYLGQSLRKNSPKFFGSGAVNLDWLAKKRSELWILLKDDIEVLSKGSKRQVVRQSDVQVVTVGAPSDNKDEQKHKPKLLNIVGDEAFSDIIGYYMRLPEGATKAYGDVIQECDSRGVVWAGNKILFVASDAISTAFQFEIRLDNIIVVADEEGQQTVEGARELKKPLQELHEGLYFPLPEILEDVLIPQGDDEIRIEVRCDWIDMKTAKVWQPRS